MGCIRFCCDENQNKRPELTLEKTCVVKAGVYKNVNVTIGKDCRVMKLESAEKELIFLCDPCEDKND